jgi:hypothetical protein
MIAHNVAAIAELTYRTARRGRRSGELFDPFLTEDGRFGTIAWYLSEAPTSITRWQRSTLAVNNGSKHGPTYRIPMEAPSHCREEKCEMNFKTF